MITASIVFGACLLVMRIMNVRVREIEAEKDEIRQQARYYDHGV